ncbi:MAG: phenylalanine--tRNA ligase subunit alpha [Oscillospiraceae bacterium]|nr:phenylalanine--tRNA ligase subunit alpha [Oscillospiraceae bacterium]
MIEDLKITKQTALDQIAQCPDLKELEKIRVQYLGKKGRLTAVLRQMGKLESEERKVLGQQGNLVREAIETALAESLQRLKLHETEQKLNGEWLDVTLPGKKPKAGKKHPISLVLDDIIEIFMGMGFSVADGREIETVRYNFDALNAPSDHPSRDEQDTFYINDDVLLRTQTSTVQVRVMEKNRPPLRIISPGRVYRADDVDATHSPLFHQLEGLVVDKGIAFADLKGTLEIFARRLYGENTGVRFRPHYFPFTEPSAEMDIVCFSCDGNGCRVCKQEGYIELLGAGMVHPNVLKFCGIDPDEYTGFAFGMGLDRAALKRYNINDMRLLFENDSRFLTQFS